MLTYLKYMSLGVAGSAGLFLLYHTHKVKELLETS